MSVNWAVPVAAWPTLAPGALFSVTWTDCAALVAVFVLVTLPQTMGKNWSVVVSPGPLWTLTYQPLAGMPLVRLGMGVVAIAVPEASAIKLVKG